MFKKYALFFCLSFCLFVQKSFTQQNQIQGIENTSYQFYSTATFVDPRSSFLTLPSLNLTGDYTIEFWYKNENYLYGSYTPIFDFRSGPSVTNGLFLRQYARDEKTLEFVANGGLENFSVSSAVQANFSIYDWNHYAFVYNASTQAISIYINGNFIRTFSNFSPLQVLNTTYCYLGGSNDQGLSSKGRFADFRVWKATRAQADIQKYLNFNVPTNSQNLYYYLPLKNPSQVFGNSYILDQTQVPNSSIAANSNPLPSTFNSQNSILSKYNYELNPQATSLYLTTNANGVNGDHLVLPSLGNLGANNFTVEVWFKIYDKGRRWSRIFETSDTTLGNNRNRISLGFFGNTNQLFFSLNEIKPHLVGDENFISTNTWYHFALTYNASNDSAKIYLNGKPIFGIKEEAFAGNLNTVLIGSSNFPVDTTFVGNLANFRIWTSERTQSQIANNLYDVNPSTPSLLYYLPLNSPNTLSSLTTNIPNGTILNNASVAPNALTGTTTIVSTNGGAGAKYIRDENRTFVYGTISNSLAPGEYLEYSLPGYDATWRRVDTVIDQSWRVNLPYNDTYSSIQVRSVGGTRTFNPLIINPAPSDFVVLNTDLYGVSNNTYDTSAPPIQRSLPGQSLNYELINPPIGVTINPTTGLIYFDKTLSFLNYSFLARVSNSVGSTIAPVTATKTNAVTNEIAKVVNNGLYISNNSSTLSQKTRVNLPTLDLRHALNQDKNVYIDFWYKAVPNTTNSVKTTTILFLTNATGDSLIVKSFARGVGSRRDSGAFFNVYYSTERGPGGAFNSDVLINQQGFDLYGWNHYHLSLNQYGSVYEVNGLRSNNVYLTDDGRIGTSPQNGSYIQAVFQAPFTNNYFGAGPDGTNDNGAGYFQRLRIRKGPHCCQYYQADLQLDPKFPYLYYELLFNKDNLSKSTPIAPGSYSLNSIANYMDVQNPAEYNSVLTPSTLFVPSNASTSASYVVDTTYQKVFGYIKSGGILGGGALRNNEIIQYSLDSGKTWTNVTGYSTNPYWYYLVNAWYINLPNSFRNGLIKVRSNYGDRVFSDYFFDVAPRIKYNYYFYTPVADFSYHDTLVHRFVPTALSSVTRYQILSPSQQGLSFYPDSGIIVVDKNLLTGPHSVTVAAYNDYGSDTTTFNFEKYEMPKDEISFYTNSGLQTNVGASGGIIALPQFDLRNRPFAIGFWYKLDDTSTVLGNNQILTMNPGDTGISFTRNGLSNNSFRLKIGIYDLDFTINDPNFNIHNWNNYYLGICKYGLNDGFSVIYVKYTIFVNNFRAAEINVRSPDASQQFITEVFKNNYLGNSVASNLRSAAATYRSFFIDRSNYRGVFGEQSDIRFTNYVYLPPALNGVLYYLPLTSSSYIGENTPISAETELETSLQKTESFTGITRTSGAQYNYDSNNQYIYGVVDYNSSEKAGRLYPFIDTFQYSYDTGKTWQNIIFNTGDGNWLTGNQIIFYGPSNLIANGSATTPDYPIPGIVGVTYSVARNYGIKINSGFKYGIIQLRIKNTSTAATPFFNIGSINVQIPPSDYTYTQNGLKNTIYLTNQTQNSTTPYIRGGEISYRLLTPTVGVSMDPVTGVLSFADTIPFGNYSLQLEARNPRGASVITYRINKIVFSNRVLGIVNNAYNTGSYQKTPHNNKISLPNNLDLNNTAFTIQFWYKSQSDSPNNVMLYLRNQYYDTAGWLRLVQNGPNTLSLFIGRNQVPNYPIYVVISRPGFNVKNWNHYSLVYTPGSSNVFQLYLNGLTTNLSYQFQGSVIGSTSISSANYTFSQPFTQNYLLGDPTSVFNTNQSVYDFRIFNLALPPAVLAKNYQTPIHPPTLGLYYYLPLTNSLINYDQKIPNGTSITPANANLANNTGGVTNPQPSVVSSINDNTFYDFDSNRQILYGNIDTVLQPGEYLEYSLNNGASWTRIDSVLSTPSAAPNYNTNFWFVNLPLSFANGTIKVRSNNPARRFADFVYNTIPTITYNYNNYKGDSTTNLVLPIITNSPLAKGGSLTFRIINNTNPNIILNDATTGAIQFLQTIQAGFYKVDVEASNVLGADTASYTFTKFATARDTISYLVNNSFTTNSLNPVPNSDFIRLPNLDLRDQAFTLEFMFKKNTDVSNTFLYLGSTVNTNVSFFMGQASPYQNNNQFRISFIVQKNITVRQANFNIKNWNRYSFQYDGDTSLSVYINGQLDTVLTSSGFGWLASKNQSVLLDNNFLGGASSTFIGVSQSSFEDFRIWRSSVLKQNVRSNNQIFTNRYSRVVPQEFYLYYNLYLTNPNQQFALIKDYQSLANGTVINNNIINLSSLNQSSFVNSAESSSARYSYQLQNQRLVGSINGTLSLSETLYWCSTQLWDTLCLTSPSANNPNWHPITVFSNNNWVAYLDSSFVGGQIVVKSSVPTRVFQPFTSLTMPAYFRYSQSDSFIFTPNKDTITQAPFCTGGFLRFSITNNPDPNHIVIDTLTGNLMFVKGFLPGRYNLQIRAINSVGSVSTSFVVKVVPQIVDKISGVINNAFSTTNLKSNNTDYIVLPSLDLANRNIQIDFWYKYNGSSTNSDSLIMLDFRYANQADIALQMSSKANSQDTIIVNFNGTVYKFGFQGLTLTNWNRFVLSNTSTQMQLQVISDLGNTNTFTPVTKFAQSGQSLQFSQMIPNALIGGSYNNVFVSNASFRDFKIKIFCAETPTVDNIDNPDLARYINGLYYYLPLTDPTNNITVAIPNMATLSNQSLDFAANPNAAIVRSVPTTNPAIPSGAFYVYEPRHQIVYGQHLQNSSSFVTTIKYTIDTTATPTYLPASYLSTNSWFGLISDGISFVNGTIRAAVYNSTNDTLVTQRPIDSFYYQTTPNSFTYRVGFYGQFGGESFISTDTIYTNQPNVVGGKIRYQLLTPLSGVSVDTSLGYLTILPTVNFGSYSLVVEARNNVGASNANYFITKSNPLRDTALNYFNNSYKTSTQNLTPNNDLISMPSFNLSNGNNAWGDYTIEFWYKNDNPSAANAPILELDNSTQTIDDAIL